MKIKLENTNLILKIEEMTIAQKEMNKKNVELKCEIQNRTKKINIFSK